MFNLKGVPWGWGLEANIGLDSSGSVDTSRMIFRNINEQVYYPENLDYYCCEPLPSEWITFIRERNVKNEVQEISRSNKKHSHKMSLTQETTKLSCDQTTCEFNASL
jgi:hypothetical protein